MGKASIYHIATKEGGTPLCQLGTIMDRAGVTCSYSTKRDAVKALKKLHAEGHQNLCIVQGRCPVVSEILACPLCMMRLKVMTKVYKADKLEDMSGYCPNCKVHVSLRGVC